MPATSSPRREYVVSFAEARHLVEAEAAALLKASAGSVKTEMTALLKSCGRVLAQDICADRDLPPFRRAARDGYAVRAADLGSASENSPVRLKVVREIAAGARELPDIDQGEAAEIMTGAP